MSSNPKILALAFIGGIIPSLLWLWFWLKEEYKKPEPKGLLLIVFIMGMIGVVCVIPIQKLIHAHIASEGSDIILLATSEELIKYLAVIVILFGTAYIDEPVDWPIYLITAALGFAALENTLFLVNQLHSDQTTVGLLAAASLGQLRFLGSTLLHTVSSGILGIGLGISLHMGFFRRKLYLIIGLVFAVALHSTFNFFIIRNSGNDFIKVLQTFGFLWVVTIILMLLFEKVRKMN